MGKSRLDSIWLDHFERITVALAFNHVTLPGHSVSALAGQFALCRVGRTGLTNRIGLAAPLARY